MGSLNDTGIWEYDYDDPADPVVAGNLLSASITTALASVPVFMGMGSALQALLSLLSEQGSWDASSNTPTLSNGSGTEGYLYTVSVGGTHNFGAGAITFDVGDGVFYHSGTWQKVTAAVPTPGADGTFTSLDYDEDGYVNVTSDGADYHFAFGIPEADPSTIESYVTAAAASATNAASSATDASGDASAAASSASEASTSETNAASSATAAAASATAAATSETNAATSESESAASAASAASALGTLANFDFDTTTTMADPGSGTIRFNNATIASVTALAIPYNDANSVDLSDWIKSFADSTSTDKGSLAVVGISNHPSVWQVNGVTDNTTWVEVAVTYVAGVAPDDTEKLALAFSQTGDAGSAGGSGDVTTVAGVSPTDGDIPAADLKTALDLAVADVSGLQDDLDAKLDLTGGTLTGDLILAGAPDADLKASTKKYVDDVAATKADSDDVVHLVTDETVTAMATFSGNPSYNGVWGLQIGHPGKYALIGADSTGTIWITANGGNVTVDGEQVKNASDPTEAQDLTTKNYVDTATGSLAPKASPTFTGTPIAPTAPSGTNTTQIATTAFVNNGFTPAVTADAWHTVGGSGEPAFQNSWSAAAEGCTFTRTLLPDGRYLLDINVIATHSGAISAGTEVIIFQLPTGYYGTDVGYRAVWADNSAQGVLYLETDGSVGYQPDSAYTSASEITAHGVLIINPV